MSLLATYFVAAGYWCLYCAGNSLGKQLKRGTALLSYSDTGYPPAGKKVNGGTLSLNDIPGEVPTPDTLVGVAEVVGVANGGGEA